MTETTTLSIVVASYGRPGALCRCLIGLSQLAFAPVEVVVVADKAGLAAISDLPFADRLKTVLQAEPNVGRARNDGIAQASGDVVAFIDDDAVAEPTWAARIMSAFGADPRLAAVTGSVLGRNGISTQWGSMGVDQQGRDFTISEPDHRLDGGVVRKLHGTNMAVRRTVLHSIGGFDPAFRFYLDDTDLAFRIGTRGLKTRFLPSAVVHHAFGPSAQRDADRVPLSLYDIGASTAAFLRKHAPGDMDEAIARLAEDQRARLFRLVRRRKIGARAMKALTDGLREGLDEGRARPIGHHEAVSSIATFLPLFDQPVARDEVLSGKRGKAAQLRSEAQALVDEGARVSLFLFEPTPRAHRVRFTDGGWWEQSGGVWGRSDRNMPRIQAWRIDTRLFSEIRRIADTRFPDGPPERFREA